MKAVCYAIQLPMLPQERFRARNIMTFAQCAVFAGVFFGVPAGERLWGAVWGHTASWACHLVMLLICPHRVNRFHFVGLAIAVVWAATSITRREVERLLEVPRAHAERREQREWLTPWAAPALPRSRS